MARTDKDRPYWVRTLDETELREESHHHQRWRQGEGLVEVDCDIEVYDKNARFRFVGWQCGYDLVNVYPTGKPPKWYRDHVWVNGERTRERSRLREIAKEYNGSDDEDFDADFPNHQHRHNALWLWW